MVGTDARGRGGAEAWLVLDGAEGGGGGGFGGEERWSCTDGCGCGCSGRSGCKIPPGEGEKGL